MENFGIPSLGGAIIIFVSSILILLLAFALAFKDVIKRMVGLLEEHVPSYSVAYVKCALGTFIAAGICFKATWQPITLSETLRWAWWDWVIHLGEPLLSALLYIQAFVNQDWSSAGAAKAARTGNTRPPFAETPPPQ